MFFEQWATVFDSSMTGLWYGVIGFLPQLIIAILIFLIGWWLGVFLGRMIARGINSINFISEAFRHVELDKVLEKAGFRLDVGKFFGELVKWFIIIVFLMTSLDVLNLDQVNEFLRGTVLSYLPQVVIAGLILMLAAVIADAMRKLIMGGARAASVRHFKMLGSVAYYAIWIFAFIIALSELGIAAQFMQILFTGVVAMLALAGGLAFGLGGRDAAGRAIDDVSENIRNKNG